MEDESAVGRVAEVVEKVNEFGLVAGFAVDGGDVERLGEPVHHFDFFFVAVAGRVDVADVVDVDFGPEFHQTVDFSPDGAFVARNGTGGVNDGVAFNHLKREYSPRDIWERAARSSPWLPVTMTVSSSCLCLGRLRWG